MIAQDKFFNVPGCKYLVLFSLVFIGLLIYLDSLQNPLFWDDEVTIINNAFIRSPRFIKDVFFTSYSAGAGEITNLYRPLAILSLLFEYQLWGLKSFGYHLTNVLLHVLNALVLFVLIRKIFRQFWIAYFVGLFFLIHPIQTEVVNYASHRPELLMTLFFFLGFSSFINYVRTEKGGLLSLSALFYCLSILSKEMGLILPLFLIIYLILTKERRSWKSLNIFWLILIVYAVLRFTVLNFLHLPILKYGAQAEPYSSSLFIRLLTTAKINTIYLKLFFFPTNLHMDHYVPIAASLGESVAWLAVGFLIILAILIIRVNKKIPGTLFGGCWLLTGLLPVSNIIPINTAIAEHYLYLPSVGLFIIVSSFIVKIKEASSGYFKRCLIIISALIFITFSILTIQRNRQWNDPISLYLSTVRNNKKSFRVHNNLGVEYFRKGNFNEAEKYFRLSLEILPTYAEALNNLGVIYERKGGFKEAMRYYKKSIECKDDYFLAHFNLAKLYLRLDFQDNATQEFTRAAEIFPANLEVLNYLASIYLNKKDNEKAAEILKRILLLNPGDLKIKELLEEHKKII